MIKSEDLTEARLWERAICLDCGNSTLTEPEEECPSCGSFDVFHVSTIDAVLAKVEVSDED